MLLCNNSLYVCVCVGGRGGGGGGSMSLSWEAIIFILVACLA